MRPARAKREREKMAYADTIDRGAKRRARRRRTSFLRSGFPGRSVRLAEYDDPPQLPNRHDIPGRKEAESEWAADKLKERLGAKVETFFRRVLCDASERTTLIWSIRRHQVEALEERWTGIGVLQKVNNSRWVNKYFRAVNSRLEIGGVFAGCAEVNGQRRHRILEKYPKPIGDIVYAVDFLVHRLCPKIPLVKKAYFAITRGHNRPLAAPEVLGRLVSCGFKIVEYDNIDGLMYFAARKVREAEFVSAPTYGPFCTLSRIGRGGERITVVKLRTMHPYAEYLQEYIYQSNSLGSGGKFKDDFRITPWGRWLRRLWLDELPMVLNVLKGEIKVVGVRPLSEQYFNLYPREVREKRINHTPGLLPPFCVDRPKTFDEIVASELRYLLAYEEAPFRTDLQYFFAGLWNILSRRVKSA